jgi:hypothetical protein
MIPATEKELVEIRCDFIKLLQLKNSELKAAYLAVTGRGFTNMVEHIGDTILMEREGDNHFVVCSHRIEYRDPISDSRQVIRFSTDIEYFKKGKVIKV